MDIHGPKLEDYIVTRGRYCLLYTSVNSTDASAMKRLIIDKKIDGVYMGGNENVIKSACAYLEELNMPCYCKKEQWEVLQDKRKFKALCMKHHLPVALQYGIQEIKNRDVYKRQAYGRCAALPQ